jgi:hypothetical protein
MEEGSDELADIRRRLADLEAGQRELRGMIAGLRDREQSAKRTYRKKRNKRPYSGAPAAAPKFKGGGKFRPKP